MSVDWMGVRDGEENAGDAAGYELQSLVRTSLHGPWT